MKLVVLVKPNARQESVELKDDGTYLIRVNAPPTEGRANERVIVFIFERPIHASRKQTNNWHDSKSNSQLLA